MKAPADLYADDTLVGRVLPMTVNADGGITVIKLVKYHAADAPRFSANGRPGRVMADIRNRALNG